MTRNRFASARRISAWTLAGALSCAVHCYAAPVANLSRPSVDFGQIGVGTKSSVQPVFVTNTGDAPLTISALTLGGPQAGEFAVAGTCGPPITLAPGDQCRIDTTVTIADTVPQFRFGTLTLVSNATQVSATISLSVVGLLDITSGWVPSPLWIDFGNQVAGTAAANRTLTLRNPEASLTVVEAVVLSGGDAHDFTMTSDCVGKAIGLGSACAATIAFTPSGAGPRSTELELDFHPTDNPTRHFHNFYSITGVGTTSGTLNLNQHGLTGSWFQMLTSGQGVEVEVYQDLIAPGTGFMQSAWFTYDYKAPGGPSSQRWYTFSGNVQSGQPSATLALYENTGGNFDAPPVTMAMPVGSVVVSAADCNHLTMTYTFTDGSARSGMVPMTRLLPNVTCVASGPETPNADFGYSGNWFDKTTSGQGIVFELNPNQPLAWLTWYTYAPNGQALGEAGQRWYTAQAAYTPGARTVPMTLYETTGGLFDKSTPTPTTVPVGMATATFTSCTALKLDFNFTAGSSAGASGTINMTRVGPTPGGCGP